MTNLRPLRRSPLADPGQVVLRPRNVAFDTSRTPYPWIADDPTAADVMNVIHFVVPEFERWIGTVFTDALPYVKDEALADAIRGFSGQEAVHADVHEQAMHDYLIQHGVDTRRTVDEVSTLLTTALGPRGRTERQRRRWIATQVALVGAIEHMTAMFGHWILNHDLRRFGADPQMLDLFMWHGAEEVEHRMVSHDAAVYFGTNFVERNLLAAVVYPAFGLFIVRGVRTIRKADPARSHHPLRIIGDILRSMWRGSLPTVFELTRGLGRYLLPGYTPVDEAMTAQAVAYLASSPAARRAAR